MAVLRGGALNGPASPRQRWSGLQHNTQRVGFKRRARPRGSTGPRRPSGALGQRGPLGPAPLRFGPPALTASGLDSGDGRSASRPVIRVLGRGPQPHARTTITLTLWISAL